jgi:hypothetical protein
LGYWWGIVNQLTLDQKITFKGELARFGYIHDFPRLNMEHLVFLWYRVRGISITQFLKGRKFVYRPRYEEILEARANKQKRDLGERLIKGLSQVGRIGYNFHTATHV